MLEDFRVRDTAAASAVRREARRMAITAKANAEVDAKANAEVDAIIVSRLATLGA